MSHINNLSISSISSLIEPTTPPSKGKNSSNQNLPESEEPKTEALKALAKPPFTMSKSILWDSSSKLNNALNLPNFNIDHFDHGETTYIRQLSIDSDKENNSNSREIKQNKSTTVQDEKIRKRVELPPKITKDYLASINKLPLAQLKNSILGLAKDQYGCRFLQKKIDENLISLYQIRSANFEVIFKQIHPNLYELIIDPFGNYLIQKLINFCSETNLNLILEILQHNLFQISINQHGTRALQKIIDNLNNSYQLELLTKGLKAYIIELIKDLNGNHVIQKILNKYQPIDCQFIYDSIIKDLFIVATHKHGCCVLQKCLNHVTVSQLNEFSNCILNFSNFQLLINDQFGNYVLQYLILINSLEINYKIFHNFVKYGINNLCNLKFSSNVIEKFLKNCFNNEIVDSNFSNLKYDVIYHILINDLNKLINDPYGNYVIQTLIDILENPNQDVVPTKLLRLIPQGESTNDAQIVIIRYWFQNCKIVSSFGKRIQSKVNTILSSGKYGRSQQPQQQQFQQQHQNPQQQYNPQFQHQQNHYNQFQPHHQPQFSQNSISNQVNQANPYIHSHSQSLSFSSTDGYITPNRSLSVSSTPSLVEPNRTPYDNYIFTPEGNKSVYSDYVINEPQFGFPQRSSNSPPVDQLNQPQPVIGGNYRFKNDGYAQQFIPQQTQNIQQMSQQNLQNLSQQLPQQTLPQQTLHQQHLNHMAPQQLNQQMPQLQNQFTPFQKNHLPPHLNGYPRHSSTSSSNSSLVNGNDHYGKGSGNFNFFQG